MALLTAQQRMGAAALILAASTVLSRLMGLARDKIISWQFGAGGESDMYFAAFVVPDIINYLLAGGFMSITIIPLLTRRFQEDEVDAWGFFSCVFCWMAAASTLLTIGGMALAPWLARTVAPGFTPEQWVRLAFFMRIILPAQIFFLCGACLTALLFMRRQFRVPALAPLIYNGAIIAVGLLLPWLATTRTAQTTLPAGLLAHMDGMTGYCVGVTLGAALGTFALPLRVAEQQGLRLRMVWRHPLMGKFLLTALPLMLGQTIMMLDEQFLRVFGSLAGDGAVSLLNYARRITQVPVGLVGQAAAVASYPFLVSLLAQGETERFNTTLRTALRASVALIIPCAFCMAATSWPILGVIFQGGRFSPADTLATLPLTRIMLAATPFWIIYMVLVRAYYAHGDTITPAVTGTVMTLPVRAAVLLVGRAPRGLGHSLPLRPEREPVRAVAGRHMDSPSRRRGFCRSAGAGATGDAVLSARHGCGLVGLRGMHAHPCPVAHYQGLRGAGAGQLRLCGAVFAHCEAKRARDA